MLCAGALAGALLVAGFTPSSGPPQRDGAPSPPTIASDTSPAATAPPPAGLATPLPPRFTLVAFNVGLSGSVIFPLGVPVGIHAGHVWWDRGHGVDASVRTMMPLLVGAAGARTPLPELWVRVHGRFGKTRARHWVHAVIPVGADVGFWSGGAEGTIAETWISAGAGFGYAHRLGRRLLLGVDVTASGAFTFNGVDGGGRLTIKARPADANVPRYVQFRGGPNLTLYLGGTF